VSKKKEEMEITFEIDSLNPKAGVKG